MTSFLTLKRCFYKSLAPTLHMIKGKYMYIPWIIILSSCNVAIPCTVNIYFHNQFKLLIVIVVLKLCEVVFDFNISFSEV